MCQNNVRQTWKHINTLLNKTSNKTDFPNKFEHDGVILCNDLDIANGFNQFYINIGKDLATNIKQTTKKPHELLQPLNQVNSFYFAPTDENEIETIIRQMKPKTSFGHDEISPKLLKDTYSSILKPLTYIINLSMSTGTVPNEMKLAKVIPIYKSDDKSKFKNYRPVSLLPAFSKVLERVIYKRLYSYLTQNNILAESQYGFQKNKSTEMAMLELQDRIAKSLASNKWCLGLFLDLSKAFDTLDHKILLIKLGHYGLRGLPLQWFKDYLSNRKQFVFFNNIKSTTQPISYGVPQGSILGPLLFLIYINDLPFLIKSGSPILFADDSNIIYEADNIAALNTSVNAELPKLDVWFATNKLSVNVKKTKYVIFHPKNKNKTIANFTLTLSGVILDRVPCTTFLGLEVQENLSWVDHISKITKKVLKGVSALSRIKRYLSEAALQHIYNSLIQSHLTYGLTCWGSASNTSLKRLIILQKKAIRIVKRARYNSHTNPLFKSLKTLKLPDLYRLDCCKIYFRHKIGKMHPYHSNRLTPNIYANTRQKHDIFKPRIQKSYECQTINFKVATAWNTLPTQIKAADNISLKTLSKNIKRFIISEYKENCDIPGCYACRRN